MATGSDKLQAKLLATFRLELTDLVEAMERELAKPAPNPAEIFRAMHSLKGAAHAVGLADVEARCHAAESLLARVREGQRSLSDEETASLRATVEELAKGASRPEAPPTSFAPASIPTPLSVPTEVTARIPMERLDDLLKASAELRAATMHLDELVAALDPPRAIAARIGAARRDVTRIMNGMGSIVHELRLVPFSVACEGLAPMIGEIAASTGKEARLVVGGQGVALDRAVVDALRDPLRHLVRNALDHGLESPGFRRAAGKPDAGTITIEAELQGDRATIIVRDDGRGLDLAALRRRSGIDAGADDEAVARTIFQPGISTAATVTAVSGRGVGLDAARKRVEAAHGTIALRPTPVGTTFAIEVPLSLSTARVLVVTAGEQVYGIVNASVQGVRRGTYEQLRALGQPVVTAQALLGGREPPRASDALLKAVLLREIDGGLTIVVDELLDEREVVVKSLGPRLRGLSSMLGASLLDDGRVALLLNAATLVRDVRAGRVSELGKPGVRALAGQAPARRRILLVEDSPTTRMLEKATLERAGYEVVLAVDGEEAWRKLAEHVVELIVSDVEMPRLDGFELTRRVRASDKHRQLPVILLTGRETPQDRAKGLEAGADAYLAKSAFDSATLVDLIEELL